MEYYHVLGLAPNASPHEIRLAYKRLAMQHHPDRNPGNLSAEDNFKQINAAYHILSDPLKKARYDSSLRPAIEQQTEEALREVKRKKYYSYSKARQRDYVVDGNYYKIQGLAFLVFLIMAGTCFGIFHTVNYFIDKKQLAKWQANSDQLKKVNALFSEQAYEEAFTLIETLKTYEPLEFRFNMAHDSLLHSLRNKADQQFDKNEFQQAVRYYTVLQKIEKPERVETLFRLATCQRYLGHYEESLTALKQLLSQQPSNLELIYQIGIINLENLNDKDEALFYFTKGQDLFKKNLTAIYGKAFAFVIDPKDTPQIYYDIFIKRAQMNSALGHTNEAIVDCGWAVFLRGDNAEPYALRAELRIKKKERKAACEDLAKAAARNMDVTQKQNKYCH